MCTLFKYNAVPRRDTHEMQPHYSSATPIGGPEVAPPPPQKRVDPRTTTNSPVINRLQTLLCPGKGQCASKLELLDIAIPGSPAAHAIQNDPFPTPVISEKVPAGQAMQNLLAFRPTASE